MFYPERAVSTSPYGLSPALIFFISQLQGSCKPKEIWDIRCTCSIHAAKARWKAEAFLCILQGAAAGRRGAPASADSASVMQQANCTVADLHPRVSGAWFTLGEADVFPLLPSTHIPALHSGIHRWFKGTQMATPLWPHCDAICLLICLAVGSALLQSFPLVLPVPPTSPLPAPSKCGTPCP